MRILYILIGAFIIIISSAFASADPLFIDGFESGDLSKTNGDGFKWLGTNRTTVTGKLARKSADGQIIAKPSDSDWNPKSGSYSLRFHYPAGGAMSEQRFSLGGAYPEVWFRYWLRVPINYEHDDPRTAGNRKLFSLWMDDYSSKGKGPTIAWEFWRNKTGNGSNLAVSYRESGDKPGGHRLHQPFITYPADRGRWMQVVLRAKSASSPTAADGVIEFWRRWEDENVFTKLHEITTASIPAPATGPNGWANGYLMGWANAAYVNDTEWLLDEFTVSESSLLKIDDTVAPAPRAPILVAE